MKRLLAGCTAALVFAATVITPLQAAVPSATIGYLQGQSKGNEWVVMALRASGQSVGADQITIHEKNEATSLERIILGVTAGGENPASVQGRNLVAELDAKRVNNQIGDEDLLNDDMWGILAYYAAGIDPSDARIQASKQFLITHQNTDGGWGYDIGGDSDSNDTAMAISALIRAGVSPSDTVINRGIDYLVTTQTDMGGFAISPGMEADSASTAWVMSALQAAGKNPNDYTKNGNTPNTFLQTVEDGNGGFKWKPSDASANPSMTAYVAIALAGTGYPVYRYTPPAQPVQTNEPSQTNQQTEEPVQNTETNQPEEQSSPEQSVSGVEYRIEGSQGQLCAGTTQAANALELVEQAALHCDLSYVIQETSFGPYMQSIEDDEANGQLGWLYLVNWESPTVGAAEYQLESGDYVTWYFGEFDARPLRLQVESSTEGTDNMLISAVVDYYDGGGEWYGAANVAVIANGASFRTDGQGRVSFGLAPSNAYTLYANGSGYIRSAVEVVRSESQMSLSIPLETTIVSQSTTQSNTGGGTSSRSRLQTEIPEPEVSFTITPLSGNELLAFGNLQPGQTGTQSIELANTGDVQLRFTATVEGHQVFKDNLMLNQQGWDLFALDLQSQSSDTVDLQLSIPADYGQTGTKTGELIFWATP